MPVYLCLVQTPTYVKAIDMTQTRLAARTVEFPVLENVFFSKIKCT